MLIFMIIQILKASGVFESIAVAAIAKCRTYKQAEAIVGFLAMLGSAMMGGATYSILLSGGLARNLLKNFHVDRARGANILDGLACGMAARCCTRYPVLRQPAWWMAASLHLILSRIRITACC